MRRTLYRGLISAIAAAVLAAPALAEPLNLVANGWAPYTDNALAGKGQASQLVRKLLAESGYEAGVTILPWRRALQNTYLGKADGIVAIWSTGERQQKILLSEPYMVNRMTLLHRKGALSRVKSIADLKGLTIGIGLGYDYSQEFLEATHFRKDPAVGTLANLRKLLAGRVDAILEDETMARYYIEQNRAELRGAEALEFSAEPLMVLPLRFGVSRQRPDAVEIIARFNAALHRQQKATLKKH